ncbi:hypothetical protein Ciccas_014388 [Cichlidogyrus casuarinus]|uniref:Uncharacterized protein n=1 Tax=Cichlidogyrus casuarinus TaxID=1844966 RepID=A0ABD2PL35_9PLAT
MHYELRLFTYGQPVIVVNTTQVKGNVAVLSFTHGGGISLSKNYRLTVYAITETNEIKDQQLIGNHKINFVAKVHYQDVMDRLAESIAKNLNSSTGKQKDLSQELAELSLPCSHLLQKLTLIISNDESVFAGHEGRKQFDKKYRLRDACKASGVSISKCWELTLKEYSEDRYTFNRPDKGEYVAGLSVQLRFYYDHYKDGWYASKVYPIAKCSDDETGTPKSMSSEMTQKVSCMIDLFAFQVFGCCFFSSSRFYWVLV